MKKLFLLIILAGFANSEPARPQGAAPSALSPPPNELGLPFIRNYSPKEYREHDQNWAIIQDLRGVMYFGNTAGLLEYDGVSWRTIKMPNASTVRSLDRDHNGRIYVGAVGDFGYLAPDSIGQMRFVSLLNLVPPQDCTFIDVWRIHAVPEGVYFQTSTHLFRYTPLKSPPLPAGQGQEPEHGLIKVWKPPTSFHFSFLVRGRLYIRQRKIGLHQMIIADSSEGDSLRLVPGGERFAQESVSFMLPYDEERILLGTVNQGLLLYDGTSFQPLRTEIDAFLHENRLYAGALLQEGHAWAALATLNGGVAIIDQQGRFLQLLDKGAGLQDNTVFFIFFDRQGAMWLALNSGISRVEMPSPLSLYGEKTGLQGPVQSIHRHQRTLYVTTFLGVFYLPSRPVGAIQTPHLQQPHFQPVSGIATESWSLLSMGKALLAATSAGLYQIDGDRATFLKELEPGMHKSPYVLYRSQHDTDRVYVGLKDGLGSLRYDHDASRWIAEGRIEGIEETIRTIVESEDGKLWLGIYPRGVLRLDFTTGAARQNPQIERFDAQHGLPAGGVHVYATTAHPVFTTDLGLFRFDEETHKFFPDSTFGIEGSRRHGPLAEDRSGNVWLESGMSSEVYGRLSVCLRQADETYVWQHAPFLRAPEGVITAIYPETDGTTWFGGSEGLMRYDANVAKDYELEYPALIRRVTVHEDSVIFGGATTIEASSPVTHRSSLFAPRPSLSYAHNALRFEFAAPSFDAESENQFQTYLEGFGKGWSAWSKETKKDYTNLPEGEYRFRVRARNVYEHESSEGIYAFKILPPWYRSWWSYAFYGLVLAAGVFAMGRIQRRRLIKRERERAEAEHKELELKRAEELKVAYDKLQEAHANLKATQQQLITQEKLASLGQLTAGIAHEIKNPLNFVNNFAALSVDLAKELREEVAKIEDSGSKIVDRESFANIEEIIVTLIQNAEKINHHGRRADGIVKSMMQHARGSSGQRELADINHLLDEAVNLVYHGLRANDVSFNITIEKEYDETIGKLSVVPQDISRVFLNIINNACYAAFQKQKANGKEQTANNHFSPTLSVSTKNLGDTIEIRIRDNGNGIPAEIREKIFNPFFTTKPTGQGTGLGLSISYDIIVQQHHGEIKVETEEGGFTEFVVRLPKDERRGV